MRRVSVLALLLIAMLPATVRAQGLVFPAAGPIGRSFGGANTAVPLDATSALTWNPATLSALPGNEIAFGSELLLANTRLDSTIPARALGPGAPPTTRTGVARSDSGLAAIPSIAMVFRPLGPDSPLTTGIGLLATVGGSVNFPGSGSPVLNPTNPPGGGRTPPFTFGFGPQAASAALFEIVPTASYKINDWLSVGGGPVIASMTMSLDPAFFARPNDANGDGVSTFPAATHGRPYWGGGFRLGALVALTDDLNVGFAYKSPIWMETFVFNSYDELRSPLRLRLPFTIPQIFSAGVAYKGLPGTIVAADLRWLDYATTKTLGESPADGGTGWDSIWAFSLGAQHELNQMVTVRIGYTVNENPVPAAGTLFNTQLPGMIQHTFSTGATVKLNESVSMSLAYVHGFEGSSQGPILQIPGATVAIDTEYDSLVAGVNVAF
ncbi:OmpP1/FadL family transporter [Stratiformator vulcanicus]|nr:outer membrane protein transport protein [Stratiformator vulcanicus]